jgi:hypothetical protein
MARVNLTEMLQRMELELRPVLKKAVEAALPGVDLEFRKATSRRFQTWERIPDSCVKPEY